MYAMFKASYQDFLLITYPLYVSIVTGLWRHTGLGGGHVIHILECFAFPFQIWQRAPGIVARHQQMQLKERTKTANKANRLK